MSKPSSRRHIDRKRRRRLAYYKLRKILRTTKGKAQTDRVFERAAKIAPWVNPRELLATK